MKKYGLSANERVKSRKDFELLYSEGKLIFSKGKKLKALYFIEQNSGSPGVKIASAVSKKAGPAPWRNRIKRLIKEVYRLNKYILLDKSLATGINLKIIFSCNILNYKNNRKMTYQDIFPDVIELINRIGTEL